MIASLSGIVAEKLGEVLVLDVRGVGYGLLIPVEDYSRLATGDNVKLYIYEHIRETSHELFGFVQLNTKALFEQLLSVNGVGPKVALSILSIGSAENVRQAIADGDTKFIQAAPGVGKRVAERLVVELKDKVGLVSAIGAGSALFTASATALQDEAVQALVALGYSPQDAIAALANIDEKLPSEDRVRLALKGTAV